MGNPIITIINDAKILGLQGSTECLRTCDGCNGHHHWILECAEDDTTVPPGIQPHPALLAGHIAWYECKHCPAWCEDIETKE